MAKIADPDARPSSPSAMLTPFELEATSRNTHSTNSPIPTIGPQKNRSKGKSLNKEMLVLAGVNPRSSGNCSARTAKAMATVP